MRHWFAIMLASCGLPAPGGWVSDPTLHVKPAVAEQSPLFYAALQTAARDFCQAGHRCVDLRVGYGANEVRLADDADAIGADGDPFARTEYLGTKRVIWLFRRSHGKDVRLTEDASKCNGRTVAYARELASHELGHFLGFGHSADPRDLMFRFHMCRRGRLP